MPNIELPYQLIVNIGDDSFFAPSAEVFADEFGVEWVKFVPKNGYRKGMEHMVRTDRVIIIRNDDQKAGSLIWRTDDDKGE